MSSYESRVVQAQKGDKVAYAELVSEFKEIALASAFAWLGDADLARDATQDAFLDAYLHINQLKTPAAFPGWLRRIVVKYCDRQTRRKAVISAVEPDHLSASAGSFEADLISDEERDRIRLAVERLPEELRMIVALHYFGDATGPEIADFLELPLSTVKKRLRTARGKLKERDIMSVEKMLEAGSQEFSKEISLFIAIREQNHAEVARLIELAPELVNSEQSWDRELVYGGVLPFATKATPLITAVELNDLVLLKMLVEKGADVNGKCGCETGEAPLWTASLFNREEHVAYLLAQNADVDIWSASGNTPLHIAAMRGYTSIVRLLLDAGADTNAKDRDSEAVWPLTAGAENKRGWKALDWATKNGHEEIVAMLESGSQQKPEVTASAFCIQADRIDTGIKALDFFSPIRKGSLVRIPFKAGVGMMVLLGELSQGFLSCETGDVVWTGFCQPPFDLADLTQEMSEFGLLDKVHLLMPSYQETAEVRRAAFASALSQMERMREQGKDVLAIIQSVEGYESDIEENLLRLTQSDDSGSITSIVLTPFRDTDQTWNELRTPYSSQIDLDRNRSIRNLYPAIDPTTSLATLPQDDLTDRHSDLLAKVRDIFADCEPQHLDNSSSDQHPRQTCIEDLVKFFSQNFRITEPFRSTPGESVSRDEMLDSVDEILTRHALA